MQTPPVPRPFPLLESFVTGFRLFSVNIRLIRRLSFLPFAVILMTFVVLRAFSEKIPFFLLPVVQIPSSFVVGLQCALLLRAMLLQEHPLLPEGPDKTLRNRSVFEAAGVYAVVMYFVTGIYAMLTRFQAMTEANPEAAAPYMPLAFAALVLVLWGARWLWLHIPLAVDWPVRAFYDRIGGWRGSFAVFALFGMTSICVNFIAGLSRAIVNVVFGGINVGIATAFGDAVLAAGTLVLSLLFTTVSAAAILIMTGENKRESDLH